MQPVVLRSELSQVYRDRATSRTLLAYVPELHASSNCQRALAGGYRLPVPKEPDKEAWCDVCVTTDPEQATIRLIDNKWVSVEQPQQENTP